MLRRGHGRVTIFHFRNTRISKENSWWSKVGKVITHFSSRRVARIPPPPEVTAPFRRDSNDPGQSCGRGNGDGEGSGASGGGRWGGGWRAPPRATGPGAGAAHCWALRGAATRRARAGRRSRCRRWTRTGGVRGRVHLQGPACAAGRDRGRVCASDSGAPRQGLLMAGSAAPATRSPDPRQSRPGGRSAGRKPHPAHASLWPHRPPLPQRRRTLFQPPRAPPGSRRPAPSHHPHHRHRPPARTTRTTRPAPAPAPAPAPLRHCPHHLGPRQAGRTRARSGLSGATAG